MNSFEPSTEGIFFPKNRELISSESGSDMIVPVGSDLTPSLNLPAWYNIGSIEPRPLLRTGTIVAVATPTVSVYYAHEFGPQRVPMDVSYQL